MRKQILGFGFGAAIGLACAGAHAQTVRHMEVRHVDGWPALLLAGYYGSSIYDPTPIVTIGDVEIVVILDYDFIGYAVPSSWELTVPLPVPSARIYDIRVCGDVEVCDAANQVGFLQSWVYPGLGIFRSSFEQ